MEEFLVTEAVVERVDLGDLFKSSAKQSEAREMTGDDLLAMMDELDAN